MDGTKPRSKATGYHASKHDLGTVIKIFLTWKFLLLAIACASPGPGYDTSTQILLDQYSSTSNSLSSRAIEHLVLRLTRWDGIYFSSLASRGHVNEQEWAFSWALARITSLVARVVLSWLELSPIVKHALAGILISNISHLFAIIALYHLTFNLVSSLDTTRRQVAFIAACLHVISPAGLFLSAPYGESTFAFLNFSGMLSYVFATKAAAFNTSPIGSPAAVLWTIAAGMCFGTAAMIRSNGLLSGIVFAWDVAGIVLRPSRIMHNLEPTSKFLITIFAGLLVAIGFATPQVVAYMEHCTGGNTRPWCARLPPSIYNWVQEHYWEVGLFRYWTLNNLPLFLLAGPMLAILLFTACVALRWPQYVATLCRPQRRERILLDSHQKVFTNVISRLALPQIVLAVMAATSFHIQIINRISSGYPVWYIVLAMAIYGSGASNQSTASRTERLPSQPLIGSLSVSKGNDENTTGTSRPALDNSWPFYFLQGRTLEWVVRGMAMYAIIQGGLYASFLPPA